MSRSAVGQEQSEDLTQRVRAILVHSARDCDCHAHLEEALARFVQLETRRVKARHLRQARERREQIVRLLELLAEVDDLTVRETDVSAFTELAGLFDDIASAAHLGAAALRAYAAASPLLDAESPGAEEMEVPLHPAG